MKRRNLFTPPGYNRPVWITASIVALITFIVYLPALQNGFVNWDDYLYIHENQSIKSIDINFLKWSLTAVVAAIWHPLTMFSLALDYAIWGLNPLGYHLTNILFHTANTFLVLILVVRLIKCATQSSAFSPQPSLLIAASVTALLFGIHPLRVESVVWVSERKDVLCAFFFLLSLLSYLKYTSADNSKRSLFYAASLISFTLALMSKPMAVSLPAVLLVLDFYPLRRLTWGGWEKKFGRVLVEKLPFFLLGILLAALTVLIHPELESQGIYSLKERIFVAVHSFVSYLFKTVLPFNLAPFYPRLSIANIFSFEYIRPFIWLSAIIIIYIWPSKRNKLLTAIWLYYTATLMPVLGQVGAQPEADRYTYLASLGPFLLLGIGIEHLFESCSKKQQAILIAALFFLFVAMTNKTQGQISVWKDSVTLWSHEIKLFPYVEMAYNNRGTAYIELGHHQLAIKDLNTTIKLNPKFIEAYYNRGNAHKSLGNYQQAINDFSKVIELNPPLTWLISAYNSRGMSYRSLGLYKEAIKDIERAGGLRQR